MDFIIDILVEVFFETLAQGFIALSSSFMPNKTLSKKTQDILCVIFVLMGLLMFIAFIVGIILLIESRGKSQLGLAFVIICGLYVISSIILKIVSTVKKQSNSHNCTPKEKNNGITHNDKSNI